MISAGLENTTCALGLPEVCDADKDELTEQVQAVYIMSLGAVLLGTIAGHVIHTCGCRAVPESLVTVISGALLGMVLWASPWFGTSRSLDPDLVRVVFAWVLNFVALPIIIFESGWSLRLRDFVSQFGYIMFFAIIGTILSVLVVGTLTKVMGHHYGIGHWRTSFAYASLISSVDPVATLATFGSLNVDPLLFILVFGESQINDAVAITLFRALNSHDVNNPFDLTGTMAIVLFGSIAVGLGLAVLFLLVLRFLHLGNSSESLAPAAMMIFVSCFFTFQVGEKLGLSGIIAVLFNSILMGAYCPTHLTAEGVALTSYLLKQMSSLADTVIFLMSGVMGVFVVVSMGTGLKFGLMQSLYCLLGRFCAVVPLGLLSNGIKRVVGRRLPKENEHMIGGPHLFMMWHSGLRGGVSLVLVMELGGWVDDLEGKGTKEAMANGTFVLVVLYLLCFGSTTGFFLNLLGIPSGDQVPDGQTLYDKADKSGFAWRWLKRIRKRLVHPVLVGPKPDKSERREEDTMGQVIRDATEVRADKGAPGAASATHRPLRSRKRGYTRSRLSSLMQIFGSTDPTHKNAYEDIMGDVRGSGSRSSPRSSSGEEDLSGDGENDDEDPSDDDSSAGDGSCKARGVRLGSE